MGLARLRLSVVLLCLVFFGCSSEYGADSGYRFSTNATVDLSGTAVLKDIPPQKEDLLWRFLATSAEWRVSTAAEHDRCSLGAMRRRNIDQSWRTTLNGFVSDFDVGGRTRTRVVIRRTCLVSPWEPTEWSDWHAVAGAGEKSTTLKLMRSIDLNQPGLTSFLTLQGSQISIDVFEQSPDSKRTFTQHTVREIANMVSSLLKKTATGAIPPALLVNGSVLRSSKAVMDIADGPEPGTYVVSGFVNPGARGSVSLSVTDEQTGRSIIDEVSRRDCLEYTGWSANADEQFFFQCEVTVKAGDWQRSYPAHFELTFRPSGGSAGKLLLQASKRVYGWER